MIRFYIRFMFSIGASVLLTLSVATAKEPETVSFCEDPWPPYTQGEIGQAPERGYAVDFLNEISRRLDIDISLILLPWKRCLLLAEKGDVDGVMLLTKNSERERYLEFTVPLMSDNNLIWFRADRDLGAANWKSFQDLKNYRIGVVAGFNYGDEFNLATDKYNLSVEETVDIISNFHKLDFKRIDVFFVNLAAANEALRDSPELRRKLEYVDTLFDKLTFHIAFSKQSKVRHLLSEFNKVILEMKQDGTIYRILKQNPM